MLADRVVQRGRPLDHAEQRVQRGRPWDHAGHHCQNDLPSGQAVHLVHHVHHVRALAHDYPNDHPCDLSDLQILHQQQSLRESHGYLHALLNAGRTSDVLLFLLT